MATKMKVKKGDTVQILTGKDRGKRGRVIEARPSERRVIVENLNVAKRHTKPRPIRDSSRMGGAQIVPGGILEKAAPSRSRTSWSSAPSAATRRASGWPRRRRRAGPIYVRVCKREGCGQELDK